MMNIQTIAIAATLVATPIAFVHAHDNCGWCGADAQALGRALNMGAPVPCYCPPAPQTQRPAPKPAIAKAPAPRAEMLAEPAQPSVKSAP